VRLLQDDDFLSFDHLSPRRPIACFVAKTYKVVDGVKGDKVFINIVSSESIMQPSKTVSPEVLHSTF
jgi:hypothetical protein